MPTRIMTKAVYILLFTFLAGCAPTYIPPTDGSLATLRLNSDNISQDTTIGIFNGQRCDSLKEGTVIAVAGKIDGDEVIVLRKDYAWFNTKGSKKIDVSIPAKPDTVITLNSEVLQQIGVIRTRTLCNLSLIFSPEEGHIYVPIFKLTDNGCRAAIFDVSKSPEVGVSKPIRNSCSMTTHY